MVAAKEIDPISITVAYVYDIANLPLYTPQVKTIGILKNGRLEDSFGSGFFDEADNLSLNLLSPKQWSYEDE